MTTLNRPLLPSLASLLHENNDNSHIDSHTSLQRDSTRSEPASPSFEAMKNINNNNNNFKSDSAGIIRLPPLNINRPTSVESALRHTASLPNILTKNHTPLTPMVENKLKDLSKLANKPTPYSPFTAINAILTPSSNEKKRAFAFITHSKDTFGVKEPKIDNAPLARRKRRRTSSQELNILQDSFNKCITPSRMEKIILAQRCNMSEKAVQIWFQNKRQALKRHKSMPMTPSIKHEEQTDTSIPQLEIPTDIQLDATPTKKSPNKQLIKRDSISSLPSPTTTTTSISSINTQNNLKGGQALTFHIRNDKKSLTPVKTSPNNKVNKLINDFKQNKPVLNENIENMENINHNSNNNNNNIPLQTSSPIKNQQFHTFTVSPKKKSVKLQFKPVEMKLPLKEIETNIFH
ncbi:homeobox protein Yox1p [Monosporozyma servazzii]